MNYELEYLDHMERLLEAAEKSDRTGTGTQSIFGHQIRHDLRQGFPLLTTKKVFLNGVIHELLWFLKGDTNIKYLQEKGVRIWNEWADENGNLGPVYGQQWRNWNGEGIDQIHNVIERLKTNPECRRLIVSAWNVEQLSEMALVPCHAFFQFNTEEIPLAERKEYWKKTVGASEVIYDEGTDSAIIHEFLDTRNVPKYYLDLQLYQRSADWLLGVPFNVASYSLLLMMVGQVVNMIPREFIHSFGDTHLYLNHIEQAKEQLSREPYGLPEMKLNPKVKNIDDFESSDFTLYGYESHPAIKAEVSV